MVKKTKKTGKIRKILDKIFGGLNMSWPVVIVFAVIMGVYTALMAMLVPDGNSFHDIAVTPEWWVLPAILIIVNTKKPLEAALKTFVFFLISQPLVYLVQVPFNSMGWALFGYYRYWFIITLLTFPGAFLGWYIKKDKFYSGIILSVMTGLLVYTGVAYVKSFAESFPNHLISVIYCFSMVPIMIFGIFKDKTPRIVAGVISIVILAISIIAAYDGKPFETYYNLNGEDTGITFVGKPYVSHWIGDKKGDATIIDVGDGTYTVKVFGYKAGKYQFSISDDINNYDFEYYYDPEMQTVVVKRV